MLQYLMIKPGPIVGILLLDACRASQVRLRLVAMTKLHAKSGGCGKLGAL
jgi:hypothetical protein